MSQTNHTNPEWPPRSPHDALLSTPGGRARLRRLAERGSPSPSPIKRSRSTPSLAKAQALLKDDMEDEDDDDDEETLQLQLQEIQARLKLKKLQRKAKQASDSEGENSRNGLVSRSNSVAASRAQSRIAEIREQRVERAISQNEVNVPVSPIRRAQPPPVQRSPGRVLLGIDKGLRGSDISLKRAPNLKKKEEVFGGRLPGPYLQRPISQTSSRANAATSSQDLPAQDRPKTFSERMAAVRSEETERKDREQRIKKNRSMAFDIDHEEMERFKANPIILPEGPRKGHEFSRDEVLNSYTKPSGLTRSKTDPNLRSGARKPGALSSAANERTESRASVDIPPRTFSAKEKLPPNEVPEAEATQFEPYSATHLSKRIIPHKTLTRTLTGKKPFLIPDLLRTVKGPDFNPPDIEEDLVVFGIIASKSEPKAHQQQNANGQKRGKFMIMQLTDLKWELDLFLFGSAFDKFWKLTPGTIIAILNPQFMPPPRGKEATGKFSITLNSDGDTILEIGSARDLGFCKSVKKDGKTCDSWVDKRHTEFCDYHVNLTLQKTKSNRMEVNSMTFGKGQYGGKKYNSKDGTGRLEKHEKDELEKKTRYDRESHSQIFIGKSTANMLDDVDFDPDAFHRGSTKEERMTRRILAQEKERDLAKKLGSMGEGRGAEYMRRKDHDHTTQLDPSSSLASSDTIASDAASLGLLGGKAKDVMLSPIKRKRSQIPSGTSAIGWGSDLTKQLGRMKEGESLQPVKKKTRFVTEKGIREAGRESFGGEAVKAAVDELDDDDDDLDIVRE